MGRTWVLALLCAPCARGTGAGGSASFLIELLDVTCAGKPYEGHVVDVQITVK